MPHLRPRVFAAHVVGVDDDGVPEIEVYFATGNRDSFELNLGFEELSAETLELQTDWTWDDPDAVDGLLRDLEKVVATRAQFTPTWPTQNNGVNLSRLMNDVEASLGTHFRMGFDKRLWWYHRGVYLPTGEAAARQRVHELLHKADTYRPQHASGVVAGFEDRTKNTPLPERPSERWVNVRNGMLDWRTGELRAHDSRYASAVQLPVEWHPDAACPAVEKFLSEVLPADCVEEFVWELVGYFLLPGNPLRKAVLLHGPGATGKSTFLKLLWSLLGARNCVAVPLQDLTGENRFAAAQLFGKLANIAGDLDPTAVRRSGKFKEITGGDPLQAEHKNQPSFTFHPFAKLIFSANKLPRSFDTTEAYFDRWLVVPFERRRDEAGRDPELAAKLTTRAELEGLLARSVAGLRRLLDRGRLDPPASVRAATEGYRNDSDTVARFLREKVVRQEGARVAGVELKRHYLDWCELRREEADAKGFHARVAELTGCEYKVVRVEGGVVKGHEELRLRAPGERVEGDQ